MYKDEAEVFRNYISPGYPGGTNGIILDLSYLGGASIASFVTPVKFTDNLQECELGFKFNGLRCDKEVNTIRSKSLSKLYLASYNGTAPFQAYQIGFYFRATPKMFESGAGEVIVINSEPLYSSERFFKLSLRQSDNQLILSQGGYPMNVLNFGS